jgi:Immunity protein 49
VSRSELLRENALFLVEALTAALGAAPAQEERDRLLFELSRNHRIAGIGALLALADADEFRRELSRSGEARRQMLSAGLRPGAPPSRYRRASHVGPFFDALVGGADGVAAEIARRSPAAWGEGEEFQDDFHYARFVHAFFLGGCRPAPEAEAALADLRRCLEGEEPARLLLCAALLAGSQQDLERGMEALLREREDEVLGREKGPVADPARHFSEKYVFVEGLALLHLAERRGLAAPRGYPAIPDLARRPPAPS